MGVKGLSQATSTRDTIHPGLAGHWWLCVCVSGVSELAYGGTWQSAPEVGGPPMFWLQACVCVEGGSYVWCLGSGSCLTFSLALMALRRDLAQKFLQWKWSGGGSALPLLTKAGGPHV